jgi:streptogramin lyase
MNSKTGEIKNYTDNDPKNNNRYLKILPEGDSVLWLSGFGNGLNRFSLTTHLFQMYINKQILWKIVFDKNHNIWCANNDGYLEKFDTHNKTFSTFRFDTLTERSIYFDLTYDSASNSLWVTSLNGLLKVDTKSLIANLFTEKDGLPTTRISLLTWDNKHRLWIGTNHGLSLYDLQKKTFRNFYINNGLSTGKLDYCLSAQPDGKLYIGADNSIMVMDIDNIEMQNETPSVYITGITENGVPVESKNNRRIELAYDRNNLSFEFAIPDFINSEDNQLLYKLEGWDHAFIQTKKGSVNYNKLPPGEYVFTVKAIDHNGIKNNVGDSVTVLIRPPFWDTWWFISLIGLIIIAILVLVIRYISQRNLKEKLLKLEKEQAVEKERNRISHDMHDDLGSGLTKIAILSEVVKKQINEPQKAKEQLDKISESSRALVDNLQDISRVLNPKNDTLQNLAAYIRESSLKFF